MHMMSEHIPAKDEKKDLKEEVKVTELGPALQFQLSEHLRTEFSEFGYIRVFGSEENPLFIATDVAKAIGLNRFKLENNTFLVEGKHYNRQVVTGVHSQGVVLLNERGLYLMLAKSNSKLSEKFLDFIYVVLKELRTKGSITLTAAVERYKSDVKSLNNQLDEKHAAFVRQQRDTERYYMQAFELKLKLESTDQKTKTLERALRGDNQHSVVSKLKEKYMKRLFIVLVAPPKEVADEFTYDVKEEEPTNDEECVFSLTSKEPETSCGEVYMHKDKKMSEIHEYLVAKGFGIKSKDDFLKNKYRATIDQLMEIFDELAEL